MARLSPPDQSLIAAAEEAVRACGRDPVHTVGAALQTRSGKVYRGVNVHAQGGGACAELVVLGMAISDGETAFAAIVAVGDKGRGVVPPCGACRQLLLDYAPDIMVISEYEGAITKCRITELLPVAYTSWFAG